MPDINHILEMYIFLYLQVREMDLILRVQKFKDGKKLYVQITWVILFSF